MNFAHATLLTKHRVPHFLYQYVYLIDATSFDQKIFILYRQSLSFFSNCLSLSYTEYHPLFISGYLTQVTLFIKIWFSYSGYSLFTMASLPYTGNFCFIRNILGFWDSKVRKGLLISQPR